MFIYYFIKYYFLLFIYYYILLALTSYFSNYFLLTMIWTSTDIGTARVVRLAARERIESRRRHDDRRQGLARQRSPPGTGTSRLVFRSSGRGGADDSGRGCSGRGLQVLRGVIEWKVYYGRVGAIFKPFVVILHWMIMMTLLVISKCRWFCINHISNNISIINTNWSVTNARSAMSTKVNWTPLEPGRCARSSSCWCRTPISSGGGTWSPWRRPRRMRQPHLAWSLRPTVLSIMMTMMMMMMMMVVVSSVVMVTVTMPPKETRW